MRNTTLISASFLALAMVFYGGAFGLADAASVNAVEEEQEAYAQMIEDLVNEAKAVPVDASSFAPFERPSVVLRQQLDTIGLPTDVKENDPQVDLEKALYILAVARGQDTSVLSGWEAPPMDPHVERAMARVVVIAADIEVEMQQALRDLAVEDVQNIEAFMAMVQTAYETKDFSPLVNNDDILASPILNAPASPDVWNAMVALAADSIRLTEATEDLNDLLLSLDDPFMAQEEGPAGFVDPTGNVEVAGATDDSHGFGDERTLMIELGGNDSYTGFHACGSALFLSGVVADTPAGPVPRAAAAYIDLDGNDDHLAILCGTGGGALGAGVLMDAAGDDTYLAGGFAQGGGLVGVGVHADAQGNDIYGGVAFVQGAATVGAGVLTDATGDDLYVGLGAAQGFGLGTAIIADAAGAGLLADGDGEDIFGAITFAQGFGAINGVGTAVHVAGDDTFVIANPLGQLFPAIGQGAGIELGAGTLAGGSGDDTYGLIGAALLFDPVTAVAQGQGYGGSGGVGAFADPTGSDYNLILAASGDVAFGGAGGTTTAIAGGQGLGEDEGFGVYIDGSSVAVEPNVDENDPTASSVATTTDNDGRFINAISVNAALALGEDASVDDAIAIAAGQGAGRDSGAGVLVSGTGDAANSLTADALVIAGAADADADFGFDIDAAFDICVDVDFSATFGSFTQAFAFCSADARASAAAEAHATAVSNAAAGDAIATTNGQGFGSHNGIGVLADAGGSDTYEQMANSLPVALALAVSISATITLALALANADSIAFALGSDLDFGSFSVASNTAFARAVAVSFAKADASAVATAVAEATATVGAAVPTTIGQGAGTENGVGALVDNAGPDQFVMHSLAKPVGAAGVLATSAAAAIAGAAAISLSLATALASAFAFAVDADADIDFDFDFGFGAGGGSFLAIATALAAAFAAAFSVAFANALALATAGAEAEAIATAIADALASATSAGAASVSMGDSAATSLGQGFGMLNGVGLLLRTGVRERVEAPDTPELPVQPPEPPATPDLPPEVQAIIDEAGGTVPDPNDVTDQPQGDILLLSTSSAPAVNVLSGAFALAFAEAIAVAFAGALSAAGAIAGAASAAAALATAIATAIATASAFCLSISFGVAACLAIAIAGALAIAVAAAIAVATATALASAFGLSFSLATALANSKESAASASSVAASVGQVSATSQGQGYARLNGVGATTGGNDADTYAIGSDARVEGLMLSFSVGLLDGACASTAAFSAGGITATSEGQANTKTSGTSALADAGGDDTYVMTATVSDDLDMIADGECGDGAQAGAVSKAVGAMTSSTSGQASADGIGKSALVDLGGTDRYSEPGRADNTVATSGGAVMGNVPSVVFADVDGNAIVASVPGTAAGVVGTACAAAGGCPTVPPLP